MFLVPRTGACLRQARLFRTATTGSGSLRVRIAWLFYFPRMSADQPFSLTSGTREPSLSQRRVLPDRDPRERVTPMTHTRERQPQKTEIATHLAQRRTQTEMPRKTVRKNAEVFIFLLFPQGLFTTLFFRVRRGGS